MSTPNLRALITAASLAPTVHNVQPARWRLGTDELELFEDTGCRLTVGDPEGHDAGISMGAAAEGLRLAAGRAGLSADQDVLPDGDLPRHVRPVARFRLSRTSKPPDPLASFVDARSSWRGRFAQVTEADRARSRALALTDGVAVIDDPRVLQRVATLFDAASYGFMRQPGFRDELVGWMRLSRRHPRWSIDGLNARAMAMNRMESFGAGVVLGRGFGLLDRLGLASTLLSEGTKVAGAAGVVVFHRPAGEAPFDSGAHFYRLWLRIEQAGFGAAVLAALADDLAAAKQIAQMAGVPDGRRVVSAFRIGRRPPNTSSRRARRPLDEVML